MGKILKFTLFTTVIGTAAFAGAIYAVPSLRAKAREVADDFQRDFAEREADLIEALSPSDEELASAQDTWAKR